MVILDTNVLSEVIKPAPSAPVMRWFKTQRTAKLFTTAVAQAEILYGAELLPAGRRRNALTREINLLFSSDFENRVLPFDSEAARYYARLLAKRERLGRPTSRFDGMIAAIARSHDAALATRNVRDFEHCGIQLINPWSEPEGV